MHQMASISILTMSSSEAIGQYWNGMFDHRSDSFSVRKDEVNVPRLVRHQDCRNIRPYCVHLEVEFEVNEDWENV